MTLVKGIIDGLVQNRIRGWVASIEKDVLPILFINDKPAELIRWPYARPDVNKALGLPGEVGFDFSANGVSEGDNLELYIFNGRAIQFVDRTTAQKSCSVSPGMFSQFIQAKAISQQADSVAITCWDGAHNPLGRAHVLYQIAAQNRPTLIISFLFEEFGQEIWPPLADKNFKRLMIPWKQRHEYYELMRNMELSFPTVWMCKPRFPTFELTANLITSKSRLILDHDDNEHFFANSSDDKDKVYGSNSVSLAKILQASVSSQTAASNIIAKELDAHLVRHARVQAYITNSNTDEGLVKVGFIGTVHPHKGMLEAARAIQIANWGRTNKIEFHVYGTFNPQTLVGELEESGVIVKEYVPEKQLNKLLAGFDIILTGFLPSDENSNSITKYQISSKIGDALAVGRPVLVPYSESVADLPGCPGIFLFSPETFYPQLVKALNYKKKIKLPEEFTLAGAYRAFSRAEQQASVPAPEILLLQHNFSTHKTDKVPTILLIWKQYDAALYGRRVDQIARAIKIRHPAHRVIVLELCHEHTKNDLGRLSDKFSRDAKLAAPLLKKKISRTYIDPFGVEYHALLFPENRACKHNFTVYLIQEMILPINSKLILFPIIKQISQMYEIIKHYKCVVDIVDNQFSWSSEQNLLDMGGQYMSLMKLADRIVFNSNENFKFLKSTGLLQDEQEKITTVIPNWYLAGMLDPHGCSEDDRHNLIYSGNMTDRIDWTLLKIIAENNPDVTLHLVGMCRKNCGNLRDLSERDNVVYWGPVQEQILAKLMKRSIAGLVPHTKDHVSAFMNPIKVHMYRSHGLPVIANDVPGINEADVIMCKSRDAFLQAVSKLIQKPQTLEDKTSIMKEANQHAQAAIDRYIDIIASIH